VGSFWRAKPWIHQMMSDGRMIWQRPSAQHAQKAKPHRFTHRKSGCFSLIMRVRWLSVLLASCSTRIRDFRMPDAVFSPFFSRSSGEDKPIVAMLPHPKTGMLLVMRKRVGNQSLIASSFVCRRRMHVHADTNLHSRNSANKLYATMQCIRGRGCSEG
jgi:hypothetical protein